MTTTSKIKFFKQNAEAHSKASQRLIEAHLQLIDKPYVSSSYHKKAVTYPFYYGLKTLQNLGRVLRGSLLLLDALWENSRKDTTEIAIGIKLETLSLVTNLASTLLSCLSLLTRTLATLFNGYGINAPARASHSETGFINKVSSTFTATLSTMDLALNEEELCSRTMNPKIG